MALIATGLSIALLAAPQNASGDIGSGASATQDAATEQLSSNALARGEIQLAIQRLRQELERRPEDPALLINLGIALAQSGDDAAAQEMFERALVSSSPTGLETAGGELVDSRRLARKAIRMLERGEFAGN